MKKINRHINTYRSGLEKSISSQLCAFGVDGEYEKHKIRYKKPEKMHNYTPDFWVRGKFKTIIIESKGRFVVSDRQKHLLIQEQYPELDIRFVFTNSKSKICKGSKTTYAAWCQKHNFKYADKLIPVSWLKEAGIK